MEKTTKFVMLLKQRPSIRTYSQIWQYSQMKKEKSYLSTLSCYTQLWKFLAICFFIEEFKKKEKESATEYLLSKKGENSLQFILLSTEK